jgi:hypothetical protein
VPNVCQSASVSQSVPVKLSLPLRLAEGSVFALITKCLRKAAELENSKASNYQRQKYMLWLERSLLERTELAPKSNLKEYTLFHKFLNGEKRLPNAILWSFTIAGKTAAVSILYEEVMSQLTKAAEEVNELKTLRVSNHRELFILQIKYEVFLNSIYSLFESLSYILWNIYHTNGIPRLFNKQKTRFLNQTNINPEYSKLLESTDWYEEVHSIRSQSTHYLSGFAILFGEDEIGYSNTPIGEEGTSKKISIPNIDTHIRSVKKEFTDFIAQFGKIFVKVINQDSKIVYPCLSAKNEVIGYSSISLREYTEGEEWKCEVYGGCPNRNECKLKNRIQP